MVFRFLERFLRPIVLSGFLFQHHSHKPISLHLQWHFFTYVFIIVHTPKMFLTSRHFVFALQSTDVAQICLIHASFPNFQSKSRDMIFSKCQLYQVSRTVKHLFECLTSILLLRVFHLVTWIVFQNIVNLWSNFHRLYPFPPLICLSREFSGWPMYWSISVIPVLWRGIFVFILLTIIWCKK
jgi:hypothetical protein